MRYDAAWGRALRAYHAYAATVRHARVQQAPARPPSALRVHTTGTQQRTDFGGLTLLLADCDRGKKQILDGWLLLGIVGREPHAA